MRVHNRMRVLEEEDRGTRQTKDTEQKFQKNPYRFAKDLFVNSVSGKPDFGVDDANEYFSRTYSDVNRDYVYHLPPELEKQRPPEPVFDFDTKVPSFDDFNEILRKKKNASAPGPNGLPYLVYKRLTCVQDRLYAVVQRVWETQTVPSAWKMALVILIAKTEDTSAPGLMRPIALTNASGKIFFTLVQRKMTTFMLKNKYIDISIQKAFLPDISGCIEHNQLSVEALRHAKRQRRRICVSWLDLKNAYGSVRHNLIQFALWYYRFPSMILDLIFDYYDC